MWTSQVYGHHDKMACTKTHRTSQTRSIQRRNIHKEITIKNCNPVLPGFGVIALCSILHLELCLGHNSETTTGINKKLRM